MHGLIRTTSITTSYPPTHTHSVELLLHFSGTIFTRIKLAIYTHFVRDIYANFFLYHKQLAAKTGNLDRKCVDHVSLFHTGFTADKSDRMSMAFLWKFLFI